MKAIAVRESLVRLQNHCNRPTEEVKRDCTVHCGFTLFIAEDESAEVDTPPPETQFVLPL